DYAEKEKTLAKALEDLKANFYCQLCDKQYYKHQEFDNHINSYDHAHKQRLKELKQREFARNVASKLKKDERKQEKALRRLHELAEQRREVKCAPGSGPMFKSTTVAVEGSFMESCSDDQEENQNCVAQDTGVQIHSGSCGLASKQSPWLYSGRTKKQTFRRKIAFSFSFPKKASIKLESSAAVFCENLEESRVRRPRTPPGDFDLPDSPIEEKVLNYEEKVYSPHAQQNDHYQKVSQGLSDLPDAKERLSSNPSDLCAVIVYSEDVPSPAISLINTSPFHLNSTDVENSIENLKSENSVDETRGEEEHSSISELQQEISSDGPSKDCSPEKKEKVEDEHAKTSYPFTKPSQPYFSVQSKDSSTIFQWPSEMVSFTKTQPSLSFSCNPLHFDFKSSRIRKLTDTQEMTESESTTKDVSVIHIDKHSEESIASPRISDSERKIRKCTSDTESCVRLKAHDRCRQAKDCIHTSKKADEKLRARDRRHYRSHTKRKQRRRKRRRERRHSETETNMARPPKLHRQSECVEGLDSLFRGTTSQQGHPLEMSKQSAQNQAEDSNPTPVVAEGMGGRRQEATAQVNGSAGCIIVSDGICAGGEKVLGNSRKKPDNPAAGELKTTGQFSHCEEASHSLRFSTAEACTPETPPSLVTNGDGEFEGHRSKRLRIDSESGGDESCVSCQSLSEISNEGTEPACCKHGTRRKKTKLSNVQDQTPCPGVNGVLEKQDKAAEESSMKCLVLKAVCDSSNGSDQISCSIDDGQSHALDSPTFASISHTMGHTMATSGDCQQSSSSQINASSTEGSQSLLETDSNLLSELKKKNINIHSESKAAQCPLWNYRKYSAAAQACLLNVRDLVLQRREFDAHNKSCQHSLHNPPQRFHLGIQGEEKLSRECFHTTGSLFQPSPSFQTPSDCMERHCLLQIQSHGQVLHQQVFPTKLKSVLPRTHLPMSSAVLHPVHLPSSVPSGSITIRHTILQHHGAFLPPQPPIYPQVVSVSRLPVGPEMCSPTGTPFVTPPQVPVVAAPSIHPMTVTFHALPRPAMFSPMMPTHPAVIPLQPLF
ncbi:hypothetical protein DNTS_025192, partial [Danionella cerebrum]